jgi:hypothetical protein
MDNGTCIHTETHLRKLIWICLNQWTMTITSYLLWSKITRWWTDLMKSRQLNNWLRNPLSLCTFPIYNTTHPKELNWFPSNLKMRNPAFQSIRHFDSRQRHRNLLKQTVKRGSFVVVTWQTFSLSLPPPGGRLAKSDYLSITIYRNTNKSIQIALPDFTTRWRQIGWLFNHLIMIQYSDVFCIKYH